LKLWFFAQARMIGCVDCSVQFARGLASLYNTDPSTTEPIDVIADNVDPAQAAFRIKVRREQNDESHS
jgi:hypothetical protein